jgi:transposase
MGAVTGRPLGAAERGARRLTAAGLFEQGVRQAEVARLPGVTRQAVPQWHAAWEADGAQGLMARSSARTYPSAEQEAELVVQARRGAQEFGWEDQRWTRARVARVIEERYGVRFTVPGVWYLLDRLGWSWQVPVTRATQRDEEAATAWRTQTWPAVSHPERRWTNGGGSSSRTSPERR